MGDVNIAKSGTSYTFNGVKVSTTTEVDHALTLLRSAPDSEEKEKFIKHLERKKAELGKPPKAPAAEGRVMSSGRTRGASDASSVGSSRSKYDRK